MKAEDVMTRDVISIASDATVLQAARLMLQHHISGLPVVDKDGKLVGVLSEGDFLRRRETRPSTGARAGSNSSWVRAASPPNTAIRTAARSPKS